MLKIDALEVDQGGFRLRAGFELPTPNRTALIGPSGAGKSTLLSAIGGFIRPTKGTIWIDERDVTNHAPGQRPMSIVFQDGNLFPHMTAAQNIGLGIRADLKLDTDEWARVDAALDRVGIPDMGTRRPGALSGGQQSRVALARVLVQRKPLILLDEPFAALGPALKSEMLDLVAELCDEIGATLLMVTHDPEDARRICDQTLVVADGDVTGPLPTEDVLDNPPKALAEYFGTQR
jgi:thiamine transport system ATP-binding protein